MTLDCIRSPRSDHAVKSASTVVGVHAASALLRTRRCFCAVDDSANVLLDCGPCAAPRVRCSVQGHKDGPRRAGGRPLAQAVVNRRALLPVRPPGSALRRATQCCPQDVARWDAVLRPVPTRRRATVLPNGDVKPQSGPRIPIHWLRYAALLCRGGECAGPRSLLPDYPHP